MEIEIQEMKNYIAKMKQNDILDEDRLQKLPENEDYILHMS